MRRPYLRPLALVCGTLVACQTTRSDDQSESASEPESTELCPEHEQCPGDDWTCNCDGSGRIVAALFNLDGGSGGYSESRTWTYAEDGRQVEEAEDRGSDGVVDVRRTHRYDQNGQLESTSVDGGDNPPDYVFVPADGTIDRRRTFDRRPDGLIVDERTYSGDGQLLYGSAFTYDEQGRRASHLQYGNDGSPGHLDLYRWSADAKSTTISVWYSLEGVRLLGLHAESGLLGSDPPRLTFRLSATEFECLLGFGQAIDVNSMTITADDGAPERFEVSRSLSGEAVFFAEPERVASAFSSATRFVTISFAGPLGRTNELVYDVRRFAQAWREFQSP